MARVRKTNIVTCSRCNVEYEKRVDTMGGWNGMCRKCTNANTVEKSIKGIKRVVYNECSVCGIESYWIKNSGKCKRCRIADMPKGENHYKWKEDRSTLAKRQERNDMAYKEWRRKVWERDNYKCQLGNHNCSHKIEAHHIVEWSEDEGKRYDVDNGITLCKRHHPRKNFHVQDLKELFISIVNN
jgi:hypothetical protein